MFHVFAEIEFGEDEYWTATVDLVMPCVPVVGWYLGVNKVAVVQEIFWLGDYEFRVICYLNESLSDELWPVDQAKSLILSTGIDWSFEKQDEDDI